MSGADFNAAMIEYTGGARPRIVRIPNGLMEPTLRMGDACAVIPVDHWCEDSLYCLDWCGYPTIFRCQSWGNGTIKVWYDRWQDRPDTHHILTHEQFFEALLGVVFATIRVMNIGGLTPEQKGALYDRR